MLQHQLAAREPLSDDEHSRALTIDGGKTIRMAEVERHLRARLASA